VPEEVHREDAPLPGQERHRHRPLAVIGPNAVQQNERLRTFGARDAGVETSDVKTA
jgi:hypothetical protein